MANNKRKSKGNKKKFRGQNDARLKRDEFEASERIERGRPNDWRWYAENAQLVTDFASYPFGTPIGTRIDAFPNALGDWAFSAPGIFVFNYAPTIGVATDENSPVNVAARNIYSYVRHANSGHSNYDAPDLMLYLLAMDSVYAYHAWMKRIARLVMDYSVFNRYYPQNILKAIGVDPVDIEEHIQDFRGFINIFAVKAGSMCVPATMSYVARHVWMNEGLYVDSTTEKAQTYLYNQKYFMRFGLSGEPAVGSLTAVKPTPASGQLLKFSDIVTFGNSLINAILGDEDFNIMSGDILKAFTDANVIKIAGITEGEMIIPTYDLEVLSQMENAICYGDSGYTYTITQDTSIGGGSLQSNLTLVNRVNNPTSAPVGSAVTGLPTANDITNMMSPSRHILNFHHSPVSPDQVMVATRLTSLFTCKSVAFQSAGNSAYNLVPDSLGSEVVIGAYYYYLNTALSTPSLISVPFQSLELSFHTLATAASITNWGKWNQGRNMVESLDWHPIMYEVDYFIAGTTYTGTPVTFPRYDIDYYTTLDATNLRQMHEAALLSEFSIPQMGAFNSKLVK